MESPHSSPQSLLANSQELCAEGLRPHFLSSRSPTPPHANASEEIDVTKALTTLLRLKAACRWPQQKPRATFAPSVPGSGSARRMKLGTAEECCPAFHSIRSACPGPLLKQGQLPRLSKRTTAGELDVTPEPIAKHIVPVVHFIIQRKQLLGIAGRVE